MDEDMESPRSEVEVEAPYCRNTFLRVGPEQYEKFSSATAEDRWT
jgi:hypothetical protein